MEILIIILLLANLLLTFLLWQSQTQQKKDVQEILEAQADHLSDQLDYRLEQERQNSLLQQKLRITQKYTVHMFFLLPCRMSELPAGCPSH